jgi:hypothetical protein
MMRLAAAVLLAVAVVFPLSVLPAPPVTWLAAGSLLLGGAGMVTLSVPFVTAGASVALIAYALGLAMTGAAADPLVASAFGAVLVLLLAVAHFASRVEGAAIRPAVVVSEARRWLVVAALGGGIALALTAGATALAQALRGAALPVVVAAAALGAAIAVGGLIALLTAREEPAAPADRR